MDPDPIRRRLRRSAEILVDDAGLRSNLTDAQARRLLDWGLSHIKERAQQTALFTDEDASAILDRDVATVRRVMHLVNRLMEPPDEAVVAALPFNTTRLVQSLSDLTGRDPDPALRALAETFARVRPDLDDERAFALLMELIKHKADEIGEEE